MLLSEAGSFVLHVLCVYGGDMLVFIKEDSGGQDGGTRQTDER